MKLFVRYSAIHGQCFYLVVGSARIDTRVRIVIDCTPFFIHLPGVSPRSRGTSPVRTAESSTQTDEVLDITVEVGEIQETKSRADLLEIEREMVGIITCYNVQYSCF